MQPKVLVVQVGAASPLAREQLIRKAREEASRAMWGTSCTRRASLERECFSAQRCGQTGTVSPMDVDWDGALAILLVEGDAFVGILMASEQRGALFVYNVCVEHGKRGHGHAAQLFAWLERERGGRPTELTVYAPVAPHFRGNAEAKAVASERFARLLRMYARVGFRVTGVRRDMVHMRSERLVNLPRTRGRLVAP